MSTENKDFLKVATEQFVSIYKRLKAKGMELKLSGLPEQIEMSVIGKLADGTEVLSNADSLAEGADLFIRDAEGKEIPAPDGEHTLEDGTVVTVEAGLVKSVKPKEDMPEEMTAEQIQQNMDTLMGKIEELSAENEQLKAENETLKSGKTASEDEVKQLKEQVMKLKKQPAATSVKDENQKKEVKKDEKTKSGSREYFLELIAKNQTSN